MVDCIWCNRSTKLWQCQAMAEWNWSLCKWQCCQNFGWKQKWFDFQQGGFYRNCKGIVSASLFFEFLMSNWEALWIRAAIMLSFSVDNSFSVVWLKIIFEAKFCYISFYWSVCIFSPTVSVSKQSHSPSGIIHTVVPYILV